jgi:hypothetical protein
MGQRPPLSSGKPGKGSGLSVQNCFIFMAQGCCDVQRAKEKIHPFYMEYVTDTKEASLAENLRPHLETLANIRYLISMSLAERKDLGRLLETNDQALSAVIELVLSALDERPCV